MLSESSSCNGSLTRWGEGAMSPAAKCARIYYTKSFYDNIPHDKVPPRRRRYFCLPRRFCFVKD